MRDALALVAWTCFGWLLACWGLVALLAMLGVHRPDWVAPALLAFLPVLVLVRLYDLKR